MKTKPLFIFLVFCSLHFTSCKYFKKCEGVEDIYAKMDADANAFFHFLPDERMVFTDGRGVYDTAYWGQVVYYYDEKNDYRCIGKYGDCCAKLYRQQADQALYFTSRDKNKPAKFNFSMGVIGLISKKSGFGMYATKGEKKKYQGIEYDDLKIDINASIDFDTSLIYSVSKGILSMKITNDDKSKTIWERVF